MSEGLELIDLEPCPNCGFKNDSTAETCGKCGTRFADFDASQADGPSGETSSGGESGRRPGQIAREPASTGTRASSSGPTAGSSAGLFCGLLNLAAAAYLVAIYLKGKAGLSLIPDTWVSLPAVIWAGVFLLLSLLVSCWKVYEKAGQRGWYTLIPIYNVVVWCRIGGKSGWWVLLFMVPLVGWIFQIIVAVGIARRFGKGLLFGLGLFWLPMCFVPILAFGGARYELR